MSKQLTVQEQAYMQGFIAKCAEYNVDPAALMKASAGPSPLAMLNRVQMAGAKKAPGILGRLKQLLTGSRGETLGTMKRTIEFGKGELGKGLEGASPDMKATMEKMIAHGGRASSAVDKQMADEARKIMLARLGAGGVGAAAVGVPTAMAVNEKMSNDAVMQGFVDKCAEYNVDPEALMKTAFGGKGLAKLKGLGTQTLVGLAGKGGPSSNFAPKTLQESMENLLAYGRNFGLSADDTIEGVIRNRNLTKTHARAKGGPLRASDYGYDFIGRPEVAFNSPEGRLRSLTTREQTQDSVESSLAAALRALRRSGGNV